MQRDRIIALGVKGGCVGWPRQYKLAWTIQASSTEYRKTNLARSPHCRYPQSDLSRVILPIIFRKELSMEASTPVEQKLSE